ncbi:unnamed protein product [Anisakis simplex]|uniref:Uncharacterized protein n=1 Tax=Anisakis simplex TaxID=6269 RepID=A0A3P6PP64_ANISI|nr:unnamed protein product [Anisakis simplex]
MCELRIDPKITSKKSPKKFDDESWPGASDNTSQVR